MRVLVIGGTLFIGRLLVEELLRAGHSVAVLHRRPKHGLAGDVENLTADRNDADAVRGALAGHAFDAVFDNVYDWQRGTTADHVVATARACGGNLSRYVFMSSVGAYAEGLDRTEDDPLVPDDSPVPYSRHKASSERALFRLHADEGFPAVTLRPPYVYGPGNPFYREQFFWDRMADGRPIIVPGDGRRLMQFVHVLDLVWACLRVMEEPAAIGQAFNIANPQPVTQQDLVRALGRAAGVRPVLVQVPRERIEAAAGKGGLYFGEMLDFPAITMNTEKVRRLLGFRATGFGAGLAGTYASYCEHHNRPEINYAFEDSLLAG